MHKIITLKDAMQVRPTVLRLPPPYSDIMGNIPKFEQWDCTIYGRWGSGKSTFALMLANILSRSGDKTNNSNLLYVNAEEKVSSGTIGSRARQAGIWSPNIYFNDSDKLTLLRKSLENGYNDGPFRFCIIDSVNRIKVYPEDNYGELMSLEPEFPKTSFIYLLHSTKDKKTFKGPSDYGFDTGIVFEILPGDKIFSVIVEKNRFGARTRQVTFKYNMRGK